MTLPADDVLRELEAALTQRKAQFRETAADMGVVGMPATISIDELLTLIGGLRAVKAPPGLFTYWVQVQTDTAEHADEAIGERLDHDEDYGFPYLLHWAPVRPDVT